MVGRGPCQRSMLLLMGPHPHMTNPVSATALALLGNLGMGITVLISSTPKI